MKSPAYAGKPSPVVLAAVVLLCALTALAQTTPPAVDRSTNPPELNMLVLGDSILWGQGLKDDHKSWNLIKTWLQKSAGVRVRERVEAHAGAVIGNEGTTPPGSLTLYGEISSAWPTLHDQIDDALRAIEDPSQVDLILVDGCINDVNARRLMNAANTPEGIKALAQEKCGAPVEALLERIASSFPNAHIVVTGYYPVVSDKTPHDLFMRKLAKVFYAPTTGTRLKEKELLDQLALVSEAWYAASNHWLMDAVARVNVSLEARGSRQRLLFAKIPFLPEHAFAARDSHLWGFDATMPRKLLAVLTLGGVNLHANDEVRNQRSSVCEDFFKRVKGESDEQKRARKDRLMTCRLSAIAHPNRKGAVMYAEAIQEQLKTVISNPGWLRIVARSVPATP
ncbi:MAG TPA: SGNH/GDSL hydrolase family protein [Pyrinomonadaceae bacterium]|nr:SGNH/GDSL hydrolase family protein [Pyrinomonadaceae bacterium]